MPERSIEITIKPAYRKFGYLYIPVKEMKFFAKGEANVRTPIQLDTDMDSIIADLQYNNVAHI